MIFCGTVSNGKQWPEMVLRMVLGPTLMASITCPGGPRRRVAAALCKWFQYHFQNVGAATMWPPPAPKTKAQHGSGSAEEREGDGSRLLAAAQDIQHPRPQLTGLRAPASPVWEMQQIKRRHFAWHLFTPPTPQQNTYGAASDHVTGNVHFH